MVGVSLVCTLYHCMNVIFHKNCYSFNLLLIFVFRYQLSYFLCLRLGSQTSV